MNNLRMKEKLRIAEALDISQCDLNKDGDYILKCFIQDIDYCDSIKELWIWSIGEHKITGEILASTSSKFYENPEYKCLFLR